jgi:hypothetical protein
MDIFSSYATDETSEVEGTWFNLSKTASVRVARSGNSNFATGLRKAMEKHSVELEGNTPEADQVAEGLMVDLMADTILLDWKGLQFKGKDVAYSREMARTMLRIKDFRKKISGFSDNFESFKAKAEEAQGNG